MRLCTPMVHSLRKKIEINAVVNTDFPCLEKYLQSIELFLNILKAQTIVIGPAQRLEQLNATYHPMFQVNKNAIGIAHDINMLVL